MIVAREGRIGKLHRQDWPGFVRRMIPDQVWQGFSRRVGGRGDPRIRWSAKYVVLCWAVIGWSLQAQLTRRFQEGGELLAQLFPRRRRPGESYQGLTQATHRVGLQVAHQFWCRLRETIPRRLGPLWRWYGWTVMAVDGSRVEAPRTRANQRALKRAGRQKTGPQWYITWAIHLPSDLIWDWRCGPGTSSERSHWRSMIADLPAATLAVADSGFGGFDLLNQLCRANVDFLVRCTSNTTLLVEGTRQEIERAGGCRYVYLWPLNYRCRRPLRLRLIVLKRHGRRVYLLTNVMDTHRLSRPMARELYAARWDVEVEYRGLKQTMARRKVLADSPGPGAMELAGNILALALLMLHGALVLGAKAARLSVAAALGVIRDAIEAVRHGESTRWWRQDMRAAVKDEYERSGCKRARDFPAKKKETPPEPAKLRRPTRTEKLRMEACFMQGEAQLS